MYRQEMFSLKIKRMFFEQNIPSYLFFCRQTHITDGEHEMLFPNANYFESQVINAALK